MANRKSIDCRDYPSEKNCSLKISGTEDEVLDAAVQHAVSAHRHQNRPELREQIKQMLKAERDRKKSPRIAIRVFRYAPVASLPLCRVLPVVGVRCWEVCRTMQHPRPPAGSPTTEVRAVAAVD